MRNEENEKMKDCWEVASKGCMAKSANYYDYYWSTTPYFVRLTSDFGCDSSANGALVEGCQTRRGGHIRVMWCQHIAGATMSVMPWPGSCCNLWSIREEKWVVHVVIRVLVFVTFQLKQYKVLPLGGSIRNDLDKSFLRSLRNR